MLAVRTAVLAGLLLGGCDGNPFVGGSGTPITDGGATSTVPPEVARDLTAFRYTDGVLQIDMQGVSSSGKLATYTRAPALDVPNGAGNPGYDAYIYQDTALTRSYLAYVATNVRGNLMAVAASDGGQFNEHNDGGRFVQLTAFSRPPISDAPESGEFSYIGSYVGVFSPGDFADGSDPRPPGLRPAEPWVVTGTVQVNGDFAHGAVEGGITGRELYTQDGARVRSIYITDGVPGSEPEVVDTTNLRDLVLRETAIAENGSFLGNVEFTGSPGEDQGDYAGAFGGLEASDVAGVLWLHPIEGQNGIWEVGAFNLPRCDVAGSSPLCLDR
jgi:hypothetical protein